MFCSVFQNSFPKIAGFPQAVPVLPCLRRVAQVKLQQLPVMCVTRVLISLHQ